VSKNSNEYADGNVARNEWDGKLATEERSILKQKALRQTVNLRKQLLYITDPAAYPVS
jgi:hypothetical protein